jgi:hypothetical protein
MPYNHDKSGLADEMGARPCQHVAWWVTGLYIMNPVTIISATQYVQPRPQSNNGQLEVIQTMHMDPTT